LKTAASLNNAPRLHCRHNAKHDRQKHNSDAAQYLGLAFRFGGISL